MALDNDGFATGSARVFSGIDGSILYFFSGDSAGDQFGNSVSGAGDVDGDGFADLIVGARGDDNNGLSSGSARVFSGIDGSTLYTFNGDFTGYDFGNSVSGAGDVDGDGFADLIVGAPRDNNGSYLGSARVFSGIDGSILYTFNADVYSFGGSVSGAGDVNGDGFADLIVGATNVNQVGVADVGFARVFSGIDGSILYTFNGDSAGDFFGGSVSGAGDVDGDGFADLIVGASFALDNDGFATGSARVFSGIDGSILYTFNGDFYRFGGSVSGAGDVDGDGFADLIVGAINVIQAGVSFAGSARVFSGIDGSPLYTFNGDSAGDYFGNSVSGAGDVDGDGIADLIVGAPWALDNDGFASGSAQVFSVAPAVFRRGEFNGDGSFNLADPIQGLAYLIGALSIPCLDACDANDDGQFDLADPIYVLNTLFLGGASPVDPGPQQCGPDPTDDTLDCETPNCP